MKNLLITITLFAASSLLAEDGLLYVPKPDCKVTQSVKNGILEWRMPVTKVPITHAVLRHDTEDRAILWLELHMAERRDPGDVYYFKAAEKSPYQFYYRGTDHHADGCKWALRFDDVKQARKVLLEVKKAYKLEAKVVVDTTKSG
jgi:hypothetical protein